MIQVIAIYGPPCVGKTTLINYAKSQNYKAYDVEEFGNTYFDRKNKSTEFFKEILNNEIVFVGAADLKPEDFPENTKFINLVPPFKEYKRRVLKRDIEIPEKIGHNGLEQKYEEFVTRKEKFDLLINENLSIEETLNKIIEMLIKKDV